MNQTTRLFFASITFAIFGFAYSCQSPVNSKDEIKQLQSTVADLVERQDSLEAYAGYLEERVYEVEKEGRVSEFYLRNDMAQIKHMADSMAVKDPKNGKVWFAIGKVAGGIVRGLVPGL